MEIPPEMMTIKTINAQKNQTVRRLSLPGGNSAGNREPIGF
ncbi:hypothetical protein [Pararhizobium sp. LjRoot238]